jgi:putative FmdB family regulatory protein
MPLYTYTCPECGEEFEAVSKFGQEEAPCPECGSTSKRSHKIRRPPAVIYKASGFYVTDRVHPRREA